MSLIIGVRNGWTDEKGTKWMKIENDEFNHWCLVRKIKMSGFTGS